MNDDGVVNSAILLLSIGEEQAAEVFKFLTPKEVQKLGQTMAKLTSIKRERIEEVLDQFNLEADAQTSLGMDSNEYIRSVLTKALGEDRAGLLLDRIMQGGDTSGIEGLKWMESTMVAELIKNEHPQIIASILVHLERDHSAAVLNQFADRLRSDVILRVATLDGIQPLALRELNDVLAKVISGTDNIKKAPMGGVRAAAEILNFMGSSNETAVLETVKSYDADLAQKIVDEMFTFDNLIDLDGRSMQLLLREVQSESLVVALKGTTDELRDKVFKNMSQRAAEMLRDDLESRGPVRLSECEAEQKEILKVARRLIEEGQITLSKSGEDAYV